MFNEKGHSFTGSSGSAIAEAWLTQDFMEVYGQKATWPKDVMDRYCTQLGLLICFVEACWPNNK